jgi:CheY-like chemotaxis protein
VTGAGSDAAAGGPVALVVEDDPTLRAALASNLRREGYRVLEAADGPAALAAGRRAGSRLVAVVLDLMLPGLDGLEVLRRLRADPATRAAAVVVVTARPVADVQAAALAAGADDVVAKRSGSRSACSSPTPPR